MFKISDFHFKKKKKKNRDALEIIRDMLSVAIERSNKTRILYDAHLNYRLLEKYLKILIQTGLLKLVDDSHYEITRKGKDFLQKYEEYMCHCVRIDEEINDTIKRKMILKNMLNEKMNFD